MSKRELDFSQAFDSDDDDCPKGSAQPTHHPQTVFQPSQEGNQGQPNKPLTEVLPLINIVRHLFF